MEVTVPSLCELLVRSRLLSPDEVKGLHQRWLTEAGAATADAGRFGRWLVANQYVTDFQLGRLLKGQADHFFFNEYKLLDRIGQGRMAGVYKAVQQRIGQVVAIKVLPPSKARDPQAFGRFQREARLALRLKHANVVRSFQTGQADGMHYLVMEYLDGETLEEVLKRRRKLPPAEAVRLIHQALVGLQHLHDQAMIHRDLKPANLMLVPAPAPGQPDNTLQAAVKILDIGVGRALFDEGDPAAGGNIELTTDGDMLGAPDYLAPEQARNAHAADVRADIYSLGCVLYHMLTGQPPFPGDNVVQKVLRHASQPPKPLKEFDPNMPAGLQAIMDRLMAKDPAQRYPTPEQAARALQGFLERKAEPPPLPDAAVSAERLLTYETWLATQNPEVAEAVLIPVGVPVAAARQRSPQKLLVVGGVLLLALVCGLSFWFFRAKKEKPGEPTPGQDHAAQEGFEQWVQRVTTLEPEEQVTEVAGKLKERNPGFDGQVKHEIRDGAVIDLQLVADGVTDLAPLRALTGLTSLTCAGSDPGKSKLADLTPLQGLPLAVLDVSSTQVADLSPLKGMPLIFLGIGGTQVRDLAPVKDMPLVVVNCAGTPVKDLSPLQGKQLTLLDAGGSPVEDLSPLRGMPLEALWCSVKPRRDADLLRPIATLKEINGRPADEVWKQVDEDKKTFAGWAKQIAALPPGKQGDAVGVRLKELNPGFDGQVKAKVRNGVVVELEVLADAVTDLSPVQALPKLQRLICHAGGAGKGKLASLQPLKNLKLIELDCAGAQVHDLTPLKGMPLEQLNLNGNNPVEDLTPLQGMKLTRLDIAGTQVSDLEPLRGMNTLGYLFAHETAISDLSPLQGLAIQGLSGDLKPARDNDLLRSLKALAQINNKPAAEYWKKVEAFESWVKDVAGKPAEEQVQAVADALKERNPGFDGQLTPKIENGVVTQLTFRADKVTDLSPVRALPGLKRLLCPGSAAGKGKLADLWPLKGLASLEDLVVANTAVSDLSPLKDLALKDLDVAGTPVDDLAALQAMPLKRLDITGTQVSDLSPLAGRPLLYYNGPLASEQEMAVLKNLKTLVTVNGKPKAAALEARPVPVAVKLKPKAKQPPPPATVAVLAGKLVGINPSERSVTLQLSRSVLVQDPWHTAWILHHQRKLLDAGRIKNPHNRLRFIQEHLTWLAYHRTYLYRRHEEHKNVELQGADTLAVRVLQPPRSVYDDKGNARKPTPQELEKLRGPDRSLPGYTSEFKTLAVGQVVEVRLINADGVKLAAQDIAAGKAAAAAPRLEINRIVIVQQVL